LQNTAGWLLPKLITIVVFYEVVSTFEAVALKYEKTE